MTDDKIFPQIHEGRYLTDFFDGERLRFEQEICGPLVRQQLGGGPMHPPVEAEGSWLNSKRNPKR